ncbi:MAG TPA: discoidin domain-containing protein, partial [Blastocatellia bacterium]|nr:discoidin domain-containing protein [Blastocatellia bacterium]
RNHKLGLVFECRVGRGRLMVSSFDLETSLETRPVARQLRRSLVDYMATARFKPRVALAAGDLEGIMFDSRVMRNLAAVASASSQPESGPNTADKAIDGDPNTFWLSGTQGRAPKHPHELTVTFPAPVAMSGLILMPRQNERQHEGDIREYAISVSDDAKGWREVQRGELKSTFAPQEIRFSRGVTTRGVRLTALSGFGTDTTSSLAEIAVIYAGPKSRNAAGMIEYQRGRTATPEIDEGGEAPVKSTKQTRRRQPRT